MEYGIWYGTWLGWVAGGIGINETPKLWLSLGFVKTKVTLHVVNAVMKLNIDL